MAEIVSFSLSLPLCHPQCGAKTRLLHLPSVKILLNRMELLTQNEAARVASVKTAVSTFTVLTYHSPQIIWEKVPLKPYDHSAEWRGAQVLTATFQGAMMALWGLFGDLGHWLLWQLKPFSCTQWLKKREPRGSLMFMGSSLWQEV